ncbi:phospholipase D family protein [Luteolibacter luteus]|uniref:Phospholipase D family protein n=1 Tax=Luteolibacter luteus TaxID=2728835 RepID=A0A858RG18_9BACT|nr:phospholipase D family protein [Luteolibacter luteus]QJE95655.1 phospholipase D family protein [Luteolibacter luteus]
MTSSIRLIVLAATVLLGACTGLPKTEGRARSHAIPARAGTELDRVAVSFAAAHPRSSGFHPLGKGSDALDARLGLAGVAEQTLDVQYYIWRNDDSGRKVLASLKAAAARGVRVRILIDDLGTSADDNILLAIDSHPGVEVRLFNPIASRSARLLGTVFDFGRVNRRMHNKAFVADNRIAIIGGRNIGDEYFDAHGQTNFADFDVAAIGPVVREVSASFDEYWNSSSSIDIATLTRRVAKPEHQAALLAALPKADSGKNFTRKLRRGEVRFFPGRATVVADDPAKVRASAHATETHLAPKLRELTGVTRREMLIVSPYFVPGKAGVAELVRLRSRGVRVVILTNSLASTDVAAVHSAYKKYRKPMLRAGVELYENKPSGTWERNAPHHFGGSSPSSDASLHAKTFTFDRSRMFVGSMNLDPRSIRLNTEIGILLESPELAASFTNIVLKELDQNAYRLALEGERIIWISNENGKEVRFFHDPRTTAWQRLTVRFLGLLPIEGQL